MVAPFRTKAGGLEIDGLAESIKALGKVDPLLKKEAVAVFRKSAIDVKRRAQGKIGNHPAYRLPTSKGMIGHSASGATAQVGAGVKLKASKYPWAYAAEFGEAGANVFGPGFPQRKMKRRTAPPLKLPTSSDMRTNKGGYMIQPTIRKRMPHIDDELAKGLTLVFDKALRKAGVPDG